MSEKEQVRANMWVCSFVLKLFFIFEQAPPTEEERVDTSGANNIREVVKSLFSSLSILPLNRCKRQRRIWRQLRRN